MLVIPAHDLAVDLDLDLAALFVRVGYIPARETRLALSVLK